MKIFKKTKKGFTLVELVVVIAVIAILAAVSVGAYFGVTESANNSRLEQEAKQVYTAIQTVALAPNEHSSLNANGLEISDIAKFEAELEANLGKDVALTDVQNSKDNTKPTVYLSDASIQSALGDKTYKSFEYLLPGISGKKASVDVVTGKSNIASSTAEGTDIGDHDKIAKEATLVVAEYGAANNWQEGVKYPLINIDENLKMIVDEVGNGNSGKYYDDNQWRIYQTESPEITISGSYNIILNEVKVTYSVTNTGVLTLNGNNVQSDEAVSVSGNSVSFNVGNTGTATNGQVRIKAVSVKYAISLVAEEPGTTIHPIPEPVVTTISEALEAELGTKVELSGTVTEIETPWSDANSNISFVLTDSESYSILVYRCSTKVDLGDIVTVTGEITLYDETNQVAAGSTAVIDDHDSSYDVTYIETIAEALAAEDGADVRLTGEVVNIGVKYDSGYDNISVTISDGTNEIYIYRLSGEVTGHQIITVTGKITTYQGNRQVEKGTFELIDTVECSSYVPATCLNPSYCETCGATVGTALGHTEPNGDGKCETCGYNLTAITFEFGDNVTEEPISHKDGSSISADKTYESGEYSLTLKNPQGVYVGANDLKGNSCLKLGTSKIVGSFNIEVPENVSAVIFNVAQYKDYVSVFSINETVYTAQYSSNNGEYESIEIDTSSNKTISFTTTSEGYRLMIDSIQYVLAEDEEVEEPATPVLTSISASETEVTFTSLDATKEITITAHYDIASSETISKDDTNLNWESSNNAIVTVSKGTITPVAGGEATITASYKGQSVNISVNIEIEAAKTAHTLSHTFARNDFGSYNSSLKSGSKTLSGIPFKWEAATHENFDSNNVKGIQIGSGKNPQNSWKLETNFTEEVQITKVVINASTSSQGVTELTIDGTSQTLTASATDYTFTCNNLSNVSFNFVCSAKAYYIKSISITYLA